MHDDTPLGGVLDDINIALYPPHAGMPHFQEATVTHTVPVIDYTYSERLVYEQANCQCVGSHVPFASEGEAQWGVLRRGCDRAFGTHQRDSDRCTCPRCRLVFWNRPVPVHLYTYSADLDMPNGRSATFAPKRRYENMIATDRAEGDVDDETMAIDLYCYEGPVANLDI